MANIETTKKVGFSLKAAAAGKNPVTTEVPASVTPKAAAPSEKSYEHFNFICDKIQKAKILAISKQTGFSIKEVMGKALGDFLTLYEEKNGVVDTKISKSLDDIL